MAFFDMFHRPVIEVEVVAEHNLYQYVWKNMYATL